MTIHLASVMDKSTLILRIWKWYLHTSLQHAPHSFCHFRNLYISLMDLSVVRQTCMVVIQAALSGVTFVIRVCSEWQWVVSGCYRGHQSRLSELRLRRRAGLATVSTDDITLLTFYFWSIHISISQQGSLFLLHANDAMTHIYMH